MARSEKKDVLAALASQFPRVFRSGRPPGRVSQEGRRYASAFLENMNGWPDCDLQAISIVEFRVGRPGLQIRWTPVGLAGDTLIYRSAPPDVCSAWIQSVVFWQHVSTAIEMPQAAKSLWNVPKVAEQPEVTLIRWRVIETELLERHFIGWSVENGEGRVSSAIERFDPALRIGVTRSSRVYRLKGHPHLDLDAQYVWERWKSVNSVTSERDVTVEYLPVDEGGK